MFLLQHAFFCKNNEIDKTKPRDDSSYHQKVRKKAADMGRHYNLYYLFLEDRQANPMPEQTAAKVRKNLEKFFKNIKPPELPKPLIITKGEMPENKGD